MDSKMKLFFALAIILMGMTNFYGYMGLGLEGVEGQDATAPCTDSNYCNRTLAQVQAAGPGGDSCFGSKCPGTYKSVLSCYNMTNKLIYRYDYYGCVKSGSTCVLVKHNCTGAKSAVMNPDGTFDVFNRYVAGSGCTGTPPPAVTCPVAGNSTAATTTVAPA